MRNKLVDFHVYSDDYFSTLATVLNLLNQRLLRCHENDVMCINEIINKKINELVYMQKNYKIVKK